MSGFVLSTHILFGMLGTLLIWLFAILMVAGLFSAVTYRSDYDVWGMPMHKLLPYLWRKITARWKPPESE